MIITWGKNVQHSEDCDVCCQNAYQEIFRRENFSDSIHTANDLYPDESYAAPDLWRDHCLDEAYTWLKPENFPSP